MSWPLKLTIYAICIYFTSASYTMCIPFLPVYLLELGAPKESIELWTALVFSSCFLIAGIMAPVWGKISDIKGKKSMAMRSALLLCISYSCGGIVTAPIQLLGMRIIQGFANGYLPVVLSMVSSQSPKEKLATSLSIIQSSQLVGTVSGPLIGGLLADVYGYRASFIISGIFLAIVVVITYLTPESKNTDEITTTKTSIFQDLKHCFITRDIFELLLLFFILQIAMLATNPLMALYVYELLGSFDNIGFYAGLACSIPPLVGAFFSPLWGMFGQKKGYYKVMSLTFLGSGIFTLLQGSASNYYSLLIYSGVLGLFIVGIMPSLTASLTVATSSDFRGRAFGALTMAGQFGAMFGPFLGAAVSKNYSISYQFYLSGLILIALSMFLSYRIYQKRKDKLTT